MPTIEVIGWISETGQLQVELPDGLPVGQVLIRIDLPEPVSIQPDPPLPIGKAEQPSRDNSSEWIIAQQRKMSRQNASAPDYRLNWIRHNSQQRRKAYRRSLNREKS